MKKRQWIGATTDRGYHIDRHTSVTCLPKSTTGWQEINTLLRQVIQVEMCYCAATLIFIVLLIFPKTLSVELSAIKLITGICIGIYDYLIYKREHVSVISQVAATANYIDYWTFRSCWSC